MELIDEDAYAMIATHDIKLAERESEYPDVIQNYYFDIDFLDDDLQFDCKLKNGICENFNTSYLLKKNRNRVNKYIDLRYSYYGFV